MVKRKSLLSGTVVGIIAFFIIGPLDDVLLVSVVSKFLFKLGWLESILIGCIIGLIVFAVIEVLTGEN